MDTNGNALGWMGKQAEEEDEEGEEEDLLNPSIP